MIMPGFCRHLKNWINRNGDRREEASFASESDDHINKQSNKKVRKMVENWPGDGSRMCHVLDL